MLNVIRYWKFILISIFSKDIINKFFRLTWGNSFYKCFLSSCWVLVSWVLFLHWNLIFFFFFKYENVIEFCVKCCRKTFTNLQWGFKITRISVWIIRHKIYMQLSSIRFAVSFLVLEAQLSLHSFFSLFLLLRWGKQNLAPVGILWTSCSIRITTLYDTIIVDAFLPGNTVWFAW